MNTENIFYIRKKHGACSKFPRPIHRVKGFEDSLLLPIKIKDGYFFFKTEEGESSAPLGTCVTLTSKMRISIIPEETIRKCFKESIDGKFYDLPPLYPAQVLENTRPTLGYPFGNICLSNGMWTIYPYGGTEITVAPNKGIVYRTGFSEYGWPLLDFITFEETHKYWACGEDGSTICSLDNFLVLKN